MFNFANEKKYVIQCQSDNDLLWCNDFGWSSGLENADRYNESEIEIYGLPLDAQWIETSQYFKRDNT